MQTKYRFKDGLVFLESDIPEEAMRLSHVPADDRILHREQTEDCYCMTIRCEPPVCPECKEVSRNYGDFCFDTMTVAGHSCDVCSGIDFEVDGNKDPYECWDDDSASDDADDDEFYGDELCVRPDDGSESPTDELRHHNQFYSYGETTPISFRPDATWHKKFGANGE